MNGQQWQTLVATIRGERVAPLPTGFIIDSPWLPNWAGHTILDYFNSEQIWFEDHLKAATTFPRTIFFPGFWSEYGMCNEPSAFGSVTMWAENECPFAGTVMRSPSDVQYLKKPDPRRDGLLPLIVNRLKRYQPRIEDAGHQVKFATCRGPFNIASFLLGATEFMLALKTAPADTHRLLDLITDFMVDWIGWQRECFPTIDGLMVLDDIIGFVGPKDFQEFALPRLKRVFDLDVTVKFFHNDAPCKVCAPFLADIGINLLNFGIQHTLSDMRQWTGGRVALMGNIPPRDVLAVGTPADVTRAVVEMLAAMPQKDRLVVSCGGGMPPGASTANLDAFIAAAEGALV